MLGAILDGLLLARLRARRKIDFWKQLATHLIDLVERGPLLIFGKDNDGVLIACEADGLIAINRQIRRRRRLTKEPRHLPDRSAVPGTGPLQVALRLDPVGGRPGQTRLSLKDVGSRDLANLETVAGRLQLSSEPLLVADPKVQDRLIPVDFRVGRARVAEHVLLDAEQLGTSGQHFIFGRSRRGHRLAASEQRLSEFHRSRSGVEPLSSPHGTRVAVWIRFSPSRRRLAINARPPPGESLGNPLVGRSKGRALCLKFRIVPIGVRECLVKALSGRGATMQGCTG